MNLFPKKKDGPEIIEQTIGQFTVIVSKLQQGTQDCEKRIDNNIATIHQLQTQNTKYNDAAIKAQNVIKGIETLLNGGGVPDENPESIDKG
jgi:hypothetical protein